MARRFASVIVVGIVLVAAGAAVAPALVARRAAARHVPAAPAMPAWAAGLANDMFGALARQAGPMLPRRAVQPPSRHVQPLAGMTCYLAGGSVCQRQACAQYAASQSAVYMPNAAVLGRRVSCARSANSFAAKLERIRMP